MSSDSAYERFSPFSSKLTFISDNLKYGHLLMQFSYSNPREAKITFTIDTGGKTVRQAFWKIVASATIQNKHGETLTVQTDINCSGSSAIHTFDASALSSLNGGFLTIVFKELVGFGIVPRPWDYFKSSSLTNVCLLVDGQRCYQNKEFLAHHSQYFRTLFFGEFAEKNKNEINIEDITHKCFTDLMDVLHGSHCFNSETVLTVLEDADRFDIPTVIVRAEDFMLNECEKALSVCKKLLLADKYRLARLQAHALATLSKDDVIDVTADPSFEELSNETLKVLLLASLQFK